jgi:hypothetical protein
MEKDPEATTPINSLVPIRISRIAQAIA